MNNNILPKVQRSLWSKLSGVSLLSNFYLAGGTAIALHRGHRESIDFDFFTSKAFPAAKLLQELARIGTFTLQQQDDGTVLGFLDSVKVSFFYYQYSMLSEPILFDGIRVAGLDDLAVMKLVAIAQRGTKKDFIDMYELLTGADITLEQIFSWSRKKLGGIDYNQVHFLKSLTYFEDADDDPMPKMLKKYSWKTVKRALESTVCGYLG